MQANPWQKVTVKLWYGGSFRRGEDGLIFMGTTFRTVAVDPDELCWFTLLEEAEKCGGLFKRDVDAIFFMNPTNGLERALDDTHAQIMCKMAVEVRVVECFIVLGGDVDKLMQMIECSNAHKLMKLPSKLTPRRKEGPQLPPSIVEKPVKGISKSLKKSAPHLFSSIVPKASQKTPRSEPSSSKSTPASTKNILNPQKTSPKASQKTPRSQLFSSKITPSNQLEIPEHSTSQVSSHITQSLYDYNDLTIADLFNDHEENDDEEEDPGYDPEGGSDVGSDDENESDVELVEEHNNVDDILSDGELGDDDDELRKAKVRARKWNADALKIAAQLQLEAASGKLVGQDTTYQCATTTPTTDIHGSDYDESGDEHDTPGESDEESIPGKRKRVSVPIVNERSDFSKLIWSVGSSFATRDIFRDCVTRYVVAQGRDLTFDVSDNTHGRKLGVRCKSGCPFKIYGSWDNTNAAFVIKSVVPHHTCRRTMESNRHLKSTWLAKQFLDVFKANPHWPAADIMDTVRKAYKVLIKKGFAYKVKYYAHKLLHGSMKEHYSRLGSYMAALEEANPNCFLTLFTNPNVTSNPPVFQRFYVCFDALKQGWMLGCRKILSVDSCFLKTFLGGQLIAAVGRDGNEQMFPLAWAVVEGENNESYEWFFKQLKASLGVEDGEGMTIISDEHQSILAMVAKELPRAEHRHCARHIFANWHKTYKGEEMKLLFWACAKAYNEADFTDALQTLREADPKAADAFIACNPSLFCRAYIQTHTQNDVIVSNMSETFNAYIISARSMHVIYMLEEIRTSIMQRLVEKRLEMEGSTHVVCPKVQKLLEIEKEKAATCKALLSSTTLFQVIHGIDGLTVDLEARTCTCKKWDLTGILCFHAISAIFSIYGHAEDYVSDFYKREAYLRSYNLGINPVPGQRHWPKRELPLNPSPIKVGPGRPRKKRRRDPHEDPKRKGKLTKHGLQMTCCSLCKSTTHNKRKCHDKDKPKLA